MIIKDATITNSRGDSIKFGRHFKLKTGFDLSGLGTEVVYSDTNGDGSIYQDTLLDNRNLNIEFFIDRHQMSDAWIEERKTQAYRTFNPKANPHRIDFTTPGGHSYYLMANIESVPVFGRGFENDNRLWLNGLLTYSANDPYIYSRDGVLYEMGTWMGGLEFPLEIPEEGLEMGVYNESLIRNIFNSGQATTGMNVEFLATTTVVNPFLLNVNTYEELKLNTTMVAGDIIRVSTYKRNKSVVLVRNGLETELFYAVGLDSIFLQLTPGDNLIRYDAEQGSDGLQVRITFNNMYMGV